MTVDALARACGRSATDVEMWKTGAAVDAGIAAAALDAIRRLALHLSTRSPGAIGP